MKRVASVIRLAPDSAPRYEQLHADVWPAVLAQIARSNIRNYSIYRLDDMLFSYYEYVGDDYDADMAAMANDISTQEWWKLTDPLQRPLSDADGAPRWTPIAEVFHTD